MGTIQRYLIIGLVVMVAGLSLALGAMKLVLDSSAAKIETLEVEKAALADKLDTAVEINQQNAEFYDQFRAEIARMSQIILKNTLETQASRKAVADIQMEIANAPDPPPDAVACTSPATDRALDWLRKQPRSIPVDPGAGDKG